MHSLCVRTLPVARKGAYSSAIRHPVHACTPENCGRCAAGSDPAGALPAQRQPARRVDRGHARPDGSRAGRGGADRAGEVLRPWLLARKEGLSATAAFATIILERVLDTVMVLLLFGLFLLLAEPDFARGDPLAFSRLKIGGALAALVSVGALGVMFFLAGHPGTLNALH